MGTNVNTNAEIGREGMLSQSSGWFGPLSRRRWRNFKANRRGYWSLWIFLALYGFTLFAEVIAYDRPIFVWHEGRPHAPVLFEYPEIMYGGEFETAADYRDPFVQKLIRERGGWMLWPPIPLHYTTTDYDIASTVPTPPSFRHLLGTDGQARDVLAMLVYGFRLSVTFGLLLTLFSSIIGVTAGAIQGYFGGLTDLLFQRGIEVLSSLPILYLLIIMSSMIEPGFISLLAVLLVVSWMSLVPMVRAEFLRARNFEYVRAARALGLSNRAIMFHHIVPNAMVATLTFVPFTLTASITLLTALDFLGFGLPQGSASIGALLNQAMKTSVSGGWRQTGV